MRSKKQISSIEDDEILFFMPEESDHAEEYLEAIWMIEGDKKTSATISEVSKRLNVSAPSTVEMLRKLEKKGYVVYLERQGVRPTAKGSAIGRRMVRNGRLMEVFMTEKLQMKLNVKVAHSFEHYMDEPFADSLCTFLGHPRICPHGYEIPLGNCCKSQNS